MTYEVAPPLAVPGGGTGTDSFTVNGVLYGNGTSTLQVTDAGSANQILRVPTGGGAPAFGAIDLSQSSAVTGTLPIANGGTGATSAFTSGSVLFAGNGGGLSQDNANFFWDETNARMGIGTNTPGDDLEVAGTVAAEHLKGTGSTPSISEGSCAGTGGSASISGTDMAGEVTLTTGSSPTGSTTCFTVTFTSGYDNAPRVVFSPSNEGAGLLAGLAPVYAQSTTSTFSFTSTVGLLGSTTYKWNYYVIENE